MPTVATDIIAVPEQPLVKDTTTRFLAGLVPVGTTQLVWQSTAPVSDRVDATVEMAAFLEQSVDAIDWHPLAQFTWTGAAHCPDPGPRLSLLIEPVTKQVFVRARIEVKGRDASLGVIVTAS